MYPDPLGGRSGPTDDMDAAARREFFGPGGRRHGGEEPAPPTMSALGSGVDKPYIPDPTTDHPLSTHTPPNES